MKICPHCAELFSGTGWQCPSCGDSPPEKDGFLAFTPDLAVDEGFKDTYFDELVQLEAQNFWFRARNLLIQWTLHHYFQKAKSFLEIGCGTGFVLAGVASEFPHLKLFGSEISSAGLAHAGTRVPEAELFQMDARAIPFREEFDVIGAFDVLEHIEEDERALAQVHAALKPQGLILLTVPQHTWLWSSIDEYSCHVRRYSSTELHQKIKTAGFRIVMSTSFVTALLPAMMASRFLLNKTSADKFDLAAELNISPWLNFLFFQLLRAELAFIRKGFSLPVGGSRLVAARKT